MATSPQDTGKNPLTWQDIIVRVIVPGLLIAIAGLVSELTLSSIASKRENARLVTELQIKREEAESSLRKDIFKQTITDLLQKERPSNTYLGLSDRLVKLSLLSLNFGDSLSLSPLFTQFERDLSAVKRSEGDADHDIHVAQLKQRLRSLARKVASAQLTSLTQHGKSKGIKITINKAMDEYKWPDDYLGFNVLDLEDRENKLKESETHVEWSSSRGDPCVDGDPDSESQLVACDRMNLNKMLSIELLGVRRNITLTLDEFDLNEQSLSVDLNVCPEPPTDDPCLNREFRLNYFNFPKVDNTRLSHNQRFAIVLDNMERDGANTDEAGSLTNDRITVEMTLVVFPSEYASLKDRPGMEEALDMLKKAQNAGNGMGEDSQ